jgi:hypothetical protein
MDPSFKSYVLTLLKNDLYQKEDELLGIRAMSIAVKNSQLVKLSTIHDYVYKGDRALKHDYMPLAMLEPSLEDEAEVVYQDKAALDNEKIDVLGYLTRALNLCNYTLDIKLVLPVMLLEC